MCIPVVPQYKMQVHLIMIINKREYIVVSAINMCAFMPNNYRMWMDVSRGPVNYLSQKGIIFILSSALPGIS